MSQSDDAEFQGMVEEEEDDYEAWRPAAAPTRAEISLA
jgi:hypothetical protein